MPCRRLSLLAGLALLAAHAAAQVPQLRPDATVIGLTTDSFRFGTALYAMGDADGDGASDLLAVEDVVGASALALLLSSATRDVLDAYHLGDDHAAGPDATGDGVRELVTGGRAGTAPGSGSFAAVIDGATGNLLLPLITFRRTPGDSFGNGVAALGDAIFDETPDYVVLATSSKVFAPLVGAAFVLDGVKSDSAIYGPIAPPYAPYLSDTGTFGYQRVVGLGDVDLDGKGDFSVGEPDDRPEADPEAPFGRVYVFSGGSGDALYTLVNPGDGRGFGETVFPIADRTGDGAPELFVSALRDCAQVCAYSPGRLFLYDGRRGVRLDSLDFHNPGGDHIAEFGRALAEIPDIDGDGALDYVVGAPGADIRRDGQTYPTSSGLAFVYSGRTWALRAMLVPPTPMRNGNFGYALASLGDLDGDGRPTVAVGAPGEFVDGRYGRVHLVELPLLQAVSAGAPPAPEAPTLAVAPSPARGAATLTFTVPRPGRVRVALFDALGRQVALVVEREVPAGRGEAAVEAARLAPGLYLARLTTANGTTATARVTVVR